MPIEKKGEMEKKKSLMSRSVMVNRFSRPERWQEALSQNGSLSRAS
jgi:hypothetical protein